MDPVVLEAAIAPVRDELVPVIAAADGCRSILIGVDLAAGTGNVMTLWTSETAMRASDRLEAQVREQAVATAGGSMGKGLVDTYRIVLEDHVDGPQPPAFARFARWEGVRPSGIWDGLLTFQEHDLPDLARLPGYRGVLVATNELLGNTLSVSLWDTWEELQGTVAWERRSGVRMQTQVGLTPRAVIADYYQLALAPALRRYQPEPSWTKRRLASHEPESPLLMRRAAGG
jgi:hypothetical protein